MLSQSSRQIKVPSFAWMFRKFADQAKAWRVMLSTWLSTWSGSYQSSSFRNITMSSFTEERGGGINAATFPTFAAN